jgi:polyisoprenoid-binding protein YceI
VSQTNITATEAPTLPIGHWVVDTAHSSIEFGIKHLLITTVKGTFTEWDGAVDVAEDGTVSASAVVRAGSIDTHQPQRDEHLRSPDFFDTAAFPEIRFESHGVEHVRENIFHIRGEITIRDATRALELDAEIAGVAVDPWGNERVGLTLTGQLDPNDFGVDWNQELEAGGNLIGDRVDFIVNVSAVKGQ